MDQHHAYYPVGRPSVKWWRYLCWWLFQSAMINAYIVFKETQKQQGQPKTMKHISFRLDVLRALSAGRSVRQRVPAQSVYRGYHSIRPSFTCCLQVSWQEAKLFSVPEQAPYTKGIRHSVELCMSSVLCSPALLSFIFNWHSSIE